MRITRFNPKGMTHLAFVIILFAVGASPVTLGQNSKTEDSPKIDASKTEEFWWFRKLEGTWQTQTTIRNCQNGTVMENFSKFVSFNTGGTAQEVSSPSLFRSAALGIWERNGWNSFRYLLRFFRFNPDGTPAGSARAIWEVEMDNSNSYTAEATVQVIAPNGTVVATVCGLETATRLDLPN